MIKQIIRVVTVKQLLKELQRAEINIFPRLIGGFLVPLDLRHRAAYPIC